MFWVSASRSQAEHVLCHVNPRMNNPCKLNFRSFELFVWLASYTLHPRSWTVVPESHDGLEDDPASFPDLASFQGVNSLLNFQSPKTRIDLDAMMASVRRAKLMLEADVSWVWSWVGILMYISCSERGQWKKAACFRWHLDIYVTNISFDFTTCIKFTDIFAYCVIYHNIWKTVQLFSELTGITANTATRQPKEERPSDVF